MEQEQSYYTEQEKEQLLKAFDYLDQKWTTGNPDLVSDTRALTRMREEVAKNVDAGADLLDSFTVATNTIRAEGYGDQRLRPQTPSQPPPLPTFEQELQQRMHRLNVQTMRNPPPAERVVVEELYDPGEALSYEAQKELETTPDDALGEHLKWKQGIRHAQTHGPEQRVDHNGVPVFQPHGSEQWEYEDGLPYTPPVAATPPLPDPTKPPGETFEEYLDARQTRHEAQTGR